MKALQTKDFPRVTKAEHYSAVMHVPCISTSHITEADGAQLALNDSRDSLAVVEGGRGHILHFDCSHTAHFVTGEDFKDDFPPELFSDTFRELVCTFAHLGYQYLRLDSEGPVVTDLPTFDW